VKGAFKWLKCMWTAVYDETEKCARVHV